MMDPRERTALVRSLLKAILRQFDRLSKPFISDLRSLEKSVSELDKTVRSIPLEPAELSHEDIRTKILPEIEAAFRNNTRGITDAIVAELPAPRDGKDASLDDVRQIIAQEVRSAIAAIPAPQNGKDGKDAEPVDIQVVVGRVMEQFPLERLKASIVESIPEPKEGRPGKDGAPGKDAEPIHPDTVELMVRKAVDALPRPKDGQPGDKGEPGRDAIQVEPLPLLEPDKIYSRGTYVLHEGGTIRAKRNARGDELDAWEVTQCGTAEREWSQGEDPGEIILRERSTLGKEKIYKFYFPFVEYVDVWRDTKDYRRGHMVTYGGSVWHCNVTGTKAKPGTEGGDWTLAVKEGRPGKHGENGKDYTPPQPIKLNGR